MPSSSVRLPGGPRRALEGAPSGAAFGRAGQRAHREADRRPLHGRSAQFPEVAHLDHSASRDLRHPDGRHVGGPGYGHARLAHRTHGLARHELEMTLEQHSSNRARPLLASGCATATQFLGQAGWFGFRRRARSDATRAGRAGAAGIGSWRASDCATATICRCPPLSSLR